MSKKLEETNLMIEFITKVEKAGLKFDNKIILADIAKSLAMIADKLCEKERNKVDADSN